MLTPTGKMPEKLLSRFAKLIGCLLSNTNKTLHPSFSELDPADCRVSDVWGFLGNFLVFLLAQVYGIVPYLERKTLTTQAPPGVC